MTFIEIQLEILKAMYLSGPLGEDTISAAWKRAKISSPVHLKAGRGRFMFCPSSSPGMKVLLLMKEIEVSSAIVVQRMVRTKSELARVEDGPGSIARKLFRLMAIGVGKRVLEIWKGGATDGNQRTQADNELILRVEDRGAFTVYLLASL
jgi:hypothetical protein